MDKNGKISFRVKGDSNVHKCALSLYKLMEEGKTVEVTAIGAAAVNQSIKIITKARSSIAQSGKDLLLRPGMRNEEIDGKEMSLIVFNFEVR